MDMVQLAMVGGVAALLVVDAQLQLSGLRPARKTRPRHEPELWRCPFCHEALTAEAARTRCTSCGTRHHAGCWTEHGGCSVHACGSLQGRTIAASQAPPASSPGEAPSAASPEVPSPAPEAPLPAPAA